jgi:hypothetical protein
VADLVRKGTKIIVQKPSGEVTRHACKDDCVFHNHEKVSELKTPRFKRDGLVVSVSAAEVTGVQFKCPECGGKSEIDGLCDACREQWVPGNAVKDFRSRIRKNSGVVGQTPEIVRLQLRRTFPVFLHKSP